MSVQGVLLEDAIRDALEGDGAADYLRARWLGSVLEALVTARRAAGLSQADVAARMGTTQPAISRLEHDIDGSYSLRYFLDYALACGAFPGTVTLDPIEKRRQVAMVEEGR